MGAAMSLIDSSCLLTHHLFSSLWLPSLKDEQRCLVEGFRSLLSQSNKHSIYAFNLVQKSGFCFKKQPKVKE